MSKPKYVVIEGADGVGKTTLAWRLVYEEEYNYRHDGPPPAEREDLIGYYELILEHATVPAVFDRFIQGEIIYGPRLRGRSRITREQYDAWLATFRERGGVVLLLAPPKYSAQAHWEKRVAEGKELVTDPATWSEIYDEYLTFDYDAVIDSWARIPYVLRRVLR